MRIYSALQKGDYHTNHCEDYYFFSEIGNSKVLCAVMDGCTMAIDSYFASTLVGKILRKIAKEKYYTELYGVETYDTIDSYLKSILKDLFKELNLARNLLMLEQKELLTTLVVLLLDTSTKQGVTLIVGDGLVSIDGKTTDFDQNNKPDYLGFHLNEDFETWYTNQTQKITFENAQDISITTDGIHTFIPVQNPETSEEINSMEFLLFDKTGEENREMLDFKLRILERKFGLKPTDDFAMIRLIM